MLHQIIYLKLQKLKQLQLWLKSSSLIQGLEYTVYSNRNSNFVELDLKRSQRQKKIPYTSAVLKVSTSEENFFLSPIYFDKNSLGLLFQKMKNEPWQSMVYGDYLSVYTYPCDC